MKGIFFKVYFLHYGLFLCDMKHLFKELSFIAAVVCMLTVSKSTAHVLKHVAKPLQKTWRITWMKL